MKINATVFVDRLIGPFIDDALEQSSEAPARGRSGKTKAKKPKTTVNRRKKPGTASGRAKRRQQKNRR
jgi:hypothetical protein